MRTTLILLSRNTWINSLTKRNRTLLNILCHLPPTPAYRQAGVGVSYLNSFLKLFVAIHTPAIIIPTRMSVSVQRKERSAPFRKISLRMVT